MAQRHSYQAAAACDYSDVGMQEMSRRLPCSNRVLRLTNANYDCPRKELLAVLFKVSRGKQNVLQISKIIPPSPIQ
jgi:hypothetical protein